MGIKRLVRQTKRKARRRVGHCHFVDDPIARASCLKRAARWEARRLKALAKRELRLQRRVALRRCRLTKDPAKCREAVYKEFNKQTKKATKEARIEASKTASRSAASTT